MCSKRKGLSFLEPEFLREFAKFAKGYANFLRERFLDSRDLEVLSGYEHRAGRGADDPVCSVSFRKVSS